MYTYVYVYRYIYIHTHTHIHILRAVSRQQVGTAFFVLLLIAALYAVVAVMLFSGNPDLHPLFGRFRCRVRVVACIVSEVSHAWSLYRQCQRCLVRVACVELVAGGPACAASVRGVSWMMLS